MQRCDVIVVGAGMAGLSAARALTAAGRAVRVLEARDRVGGRARSIPVPGGRIDAGATWFWSNEPLIAALVQELGVATFDQYLAGDALFEAPGGGGVQRLGGNPIDVPACRFAAGAEALADALAATLPTGTVRLGIPVTALDVAEAGVRVEAAGETYHAEQVILALPPALAVERIRFTPELPADLRDTARSTAVWMGDMVKAVAVYAEPFWRQHRLAGAAFSYRGPFREIHDHCGPDGAPAALFGFAPAGPLAGSSVGQIAVLFVEQLQRLFGPVAGRPEQVEVTDWSREPDTSPTEPLARSTDRFGADVFRRAAHGRLHWASTETAPAFAGHVEGALLAGRRAAAAIEGIRA